MSEQKYASWNPWHGCTKYSEGCRYCYVYRQDKAYATMQKAFEDGSLDRNELVKKIREMGLEVID